MGYPRDRMGYPRDPAVLFANLQVLAGDKEFPIEFDSRPLDCILADELDIIATVVRGNAVLRGGRWHPNPAGPKALSPEGAATLERARSAGRSAVSRFYGFQSLADRARFIRDQLLQAASSGIDSGLVIGLLMYFGRLYDQDGIGRIPREAWERAIEAWRGTAKRTSKGRHARGEYDWRDVIAELLNHVEPESGKASRASRRRLIERGAAPRKTR
jgi:hypothetical protein